MVQIISLGLFVTITSIIFITAWFSPIPRKIGFRNVRRRWGNTILVVIGSMVGTALISGSLVLSDSLDKTFEELVNQQIGEIDVLVEPEQIQEQDLPFAYVTQQEVNQVENLLDIPEIDGVYPMLAFFLSPQKIDAQGETILNAYQVELYAADFDKISEFGTQPQVFEKPTSSNGIIVSESMSKSLELSEGDRIKATIIGQEVTMTVDKIYPDAGILGGKRIVIPYETLQREINLNGDVYNFFLISAIGGIRPDNYDGEEFENVVKTQLEEFESESVELFTTELKQEALNGFGLKFFVTIFFALSLFGIFSGVLLIINLFSMLASERQMEMGILRAIALTRLKLTQTFIYEGYLYSIASSLLGALVGVGIGYALIYVIKTSFEQAFELAGEGSGFSIFFDAQPSSLVIAFVVGALITIFTSAFTSYRISKLNIVSAIRKLEEKIQPKVTIRWIINQIILLIFFLQGLFLFVTTFGLEDALQSERDKGGDNYFAELNQEEFIDFVNLLEGYVFYLGIVFMVFFGTIFITRTVFMLLNKNIARLTYTISSSFLIILTSLMGEFDYIVKSAEQDEGVGIIFVSGVVLVIALSLVVSYNLDLITNFLGFLLSPFKKMKPTVRMALRYPAANRERTGLTLIMFALIIFLIAFISIEKAAVNDQSDKAVERSLSGYDLVVAPSTFGPEYNLVPEIVDTIRNVDGVQEVQRATAVQVTLPEYIYGDLTDAPYFGNPEDLPNFDDDDAYITQLSVISEEFINSNDIEITNFLDRYNSEEDVWNEVITDPNKVVLGKAFTTEGYGPVPEIELGEIITVAGIFGNDKIQKEVIGTIEGNPGGTGIGVYDYIITTPNNAEQTFGNEYIATYSTTTILGRVDENANQTEVINEVKKEIVDYNIFFVFDVNEIVGAIQTFINSFLAMFQGFLAFSLIVGASGLAIIVVRSVNERRQQIGMLRSLGFQRGDVLISFFIEATFITLLGIIIGISMGIVGTNAVFQIAQEQNPDLEIIIPWGEILIISSLVYISSILFSLLPSLKAARLSPVEATNYPE